MERSRPSQDRSHSDVQTPSSRPVDGSIEAAAQTVHSPPPDIYSLREAEEVWRLAARLQSEAARRLEDRSRSLAGTAERTILGEAPPVFSREEVTGIARDAGFESEIVELALRELAVQRHTSASFTETQLDRASQFLHTPEERITVTRQILADRKSVLEAIQRVFSTDPYALELTEVIGDAQHLTDSILVFEVPRGNADKHAGGGNTFAVRMNIADLNRVVVRIHTLDETTTETTLQLDMRRGKWRNFLRGMSLTAGFTVITAILTWFVLVPYIGWLLSVPGALLAALGIGHAVYWLYRTTYRGGLQMGREEMTELLRLVDVRARTEEAFDKLLG